jgi:hypothetical protein
MRPFFQGWGGGFAYKLTFKPPKGMSNLPKYLVHRPGYILRNCKMKVTRGQWPALSLRIVTVTRLLDSIRGVFPEQGHRRHFDMFVGLKEIPATVRWFDRQRARRRQRRAVSEHYQVRGY